MQAPGFPPFKALYTFAPGGAPGGGLGTLQFDRPLASLATDAGLWRVGSYSSSHVRLKFDAFIFDQQDNPAGTVVARSTVTVNQAISWRCNSVPIALSLLVPRTLSMPA